MMCHAGTSEHSKALQKIVTNYHFAKDKSDLKFFPPLPTQREQSATHLPKIKQKINQCKANADKDVINPQASTEQNERNKKKLKCICQMCTCGQHVCPPKISPTDHQSTRFRQKAYKKNIYIRGKRNQDMSLNCTIQQIKKQADKILRSSPFNASTTYRKVYKAPNLSCSTDKQMSDGNKDGYNGLQKNKVKLSVIPYNPKFHRFQGVSTFKSDYSINHLHRKQQVSAKKLQNIAVNSDSLVTRDYCHKYGKEYDNLIKMKTQPNKTQNVYKKKQEDWGQTQFKKHYGRQSGNKEKKIQKWFKINKKNVSDSLNIFSSQ